MNRIKQKEHIFSITKKDVTNQSPVMDANVGEDLQELLEKLGTLITPKLVTTEESQDWEKRRMAKRRAEYAAISSIPKHYVDLYNSGELPDLQTEQARDLVVAGRTWCVLNYPHCKRTAAALLLDDARGAWVSSPDYCQFWHRFENEGKAWRYKEASILAIVDIGKEARRDSMHLDKLMKHRFEYGLFTVVAAEISGVEFKMRYPDICTHKQYWRLDVIK
jgi:hypothetical protein